jgi:flagellar assembly protein FliH
MPSSNAIIKAKNVKILRENSDAGLTVAGDKGGTVGNVRPKSVMTAHEKDQQKQMKIVEEAKREAFEKGIVEGRNSREREIVSAMTAMSAVIAEIGASKKKFYLENEKEMLELVLAIARKVIHTEVSAGKDVVLAVLREAVKKVADESNLKVLLNPEDLSFITEMKQTLLQENALFKNAAFEGDESIKKGGVLLETAHLEVDARIEQQFEKIRESLKM